MKQGLSELHRKAVDVLLEVDLDSVSPLMRDVFRAVQGGVRDLRDENVRLKQRIGELEDALAGLSVGVELPRDGDES